MATPAVGELFDAYKTEARVPTHEADQPVGPAEAAYLKLRSGVEAAVTVLTNQVKEAKENQASETPSDNWSVVRKVAYVLAGLALLVGLVGALNYFGVLNLSVAGAALVKDIGFILFLAGAGAGVVLLTTTAVASCICTRKAKAEPEQTGPERVIKEEKA